ncbi:MAG: hypothetical protein AMXMBFR7_35460 [Planctomycetota bacterium]
MDIHEGHTLPGWLVIILRSRVWAPICMAYFVTLLCWGAFAPPGLYERDGYYHARYAQILPERGLSRTFPWTQSSTWRDNFCDKEFLFHVLLIPFCRNQEDPVQGAKIFAVALATVVLIAQYALLRLHHAPYPLACTLIFVSLSATVLHRLGMIRSHVLSILLFQAGLHFLLTNRWKSIAALGFLYSWSYTFPWVLPLTTAVFSLAKGLARGGWCARPPLAALAGVAAGSILHPYFPGTVENLLTYLQVIDLSATNPVQSGVTLGGELYPLSMSEFLITFPLLILVSTGFGWAVLRLQNCLARESTAMIGVAWLWFVGCWWMPRMIEYAAPAAGLAAGLLLRDLRPKSYLPAMEAGPRRARFLMGLGAVMVLLAAAHSSAIHTFIATAGEAPARRFSGAARWMKENLKPGETVMNLWWDDFPELFYDAPEFRYLCGLDPTYMLRWDEAKALGLEAMRARKRGLDGAWLADAFGSRLLIVRQPKADAYPELKVEPWKLLYRDDAAALYRYDGPAAVP